MGGRNWKYPQREYIIRFTAGELSRTSADFRTFCSQYPIYYTLTRAFKSTQGSIGDLVATIKSAKANCKDTTVLGSFSENHDVSP